MKKCCKVLMMLLFVVFVTVACGSGGEVTKTKADAYSKFVPEETYDYSFVNKSAQELYEACFGRIEEVTYDTHFYVKDGVLYLDEYAFTGEYDEETVGIYEWRRGQEIAKDVIYVDCNYYYLGSNALYITADHVLHGTGEYKDVYMENVKYARVYADQMLALTMDGKLWCKGIVHGIGTGAVLEYADWELILENVVFAEIGHYKYMAITDDGSLYMWGDNTFGQFSDGSLLSDKTVFEKDQMFYNEPVKVADNIKMIWERQPASVNGDEYGKLRTYFLTEDNFLFVCGEEVGDESKEFDYFGEMGELDAPYTVRCTSELHAVEY